VVPPSVDSAKTMSYDPTLPAATRSQCAAHRFAVIGTMLGKSAQLTRRSSPLATVRGGPKAPFSSVLSLSAVTPAAGSSQLRTIPPSGPAARRAWPLPATAGTSSSRHPVSRREAAGRSPEVVGAGRSPLSHPAARTAAAASNADLVIEVIDIDPDRRRRRSVAMLSGSEG